MDGTKFRTMAKATLGIKKYTKEFPSFHYDFRPIQFYLVDDKHQFLTVFVRIENGVMTYYSLLTDENKELMEKHNIPDYPSHSSLKAGKGFFNFLFLQPTAPHDIFRYIDEENLRCYVFSASDVFGGTYKYVSETSGLDNKRPGHFLIGVGKGHGEYQIYSCSFDLKKKEYITKVSHRYPAHDVRSYRDMIFATEFFNQRCIMPDGTKIEDYVDLEKYIFNYNNPISNIASSMRPQAILKMNPYKVEPRNGELFLYNQKTKAFRYVRTGFTPSHIEFLDDIMYVSSHNFLFLKGQMVYLGPASINAYKITRDNAILIGTFYNKTGYRYTAHKAFKRNGKKLVATIGHPNRLFIIDGDTMEYISHVDLGGHDLLPNYMDIKEALNNLDMNDHYSPYRYSTMEASESGYHLMYWDQEFVKVIHTETLDTHILADFTIPGLRQKTYHSEKM